MEIVLIVYLLMQFVGQSQAQNTAADASPVEVQKFSWRYYGKQADAAVGNSNTRKKTPQRVYMEDMYNRNSIENRSRDMLELENRVRREATQSRTSDVYGYQIEIKNNALKEIRLVIWDFQASEASDPQDVSHRQFRCAVRIKPNGRKELQGFSSLPPRQVISADGAELKLIQRVVINRVEYSDGESWQRPDWQAPDRISTKNRRSQCEAL